MLHKFSHKCYWIIPRLHFKRAEYICCLWTDKLTEGMKPEKSGWLKEDDGEYSVQFQDVTDKYYSTPKDILVGCSCKKNCGPRCACLKDEKRANKCCRLTCKSCSCFTRKSEHESQSLEVTDSYQNFMDNLSDNSAESSSGEEEEFVSQETPFWDESDDEFNL